MLSLVHCLPDLNRCLHDHLLPVPPVHIWMAAPSEAQGSSTRDDRPDIEFALDETFGLSQELAKLLSHVFFQSSGTPPDDGSAYQ